MKIAFFHELTPLSGAKKVVEEYGRILGREHQVDLYYVDYNEDENISKIFNNVHFFKFGSSRSRAYRDTIELIRLFLLHRKIAKIVNGNRYDLILVSPSKYTQAPFLLRFINNSVYFCQEPLRIIYDPLMVIPRNLNFFKKQYEFFNRKIRKLIDKRNIHNARIVLANSEFSKDNIFDAYGINAKVCYLGADTDRFSPKNIKKPYDVLFIGEKSSIEGYDLLNATLKTYKKKPSVRYVVRNEKGKGIAEENLAEEINKSKIVLALSRSEPFGLIPIESMACEVPVIAVNEGGFRESVIEGKTGFLIERKQEKLKDKIDILLSDDRLRVEMGKNGRKLVLDKFTWAKSVNNFFNIAKTII